MDKSQNGEQEQGREEEEGGEMGVTFVLLVIKLVVWCDDRLARLSHSGPSSLQQASLSFHQEC